MKMNKWTVALAGLGLVSLTSAQAEEAKLVPIQTALSATTISGYVDTSAQWDIGTGNGHVAPYIYNAGKQDGFNLNSVDVNISKAIDPTVPWSAGYTVDLFFGPDAAGTTGGSAATPEYIRQAFVDLSFPVGNYPDLKVGRFDQLLGFESIDSYKNANFTRSYGFSMEPTENTGALLHYKFTDWLDAQGGVVNSATTTTINGRSAAGVARGESHKAYTGMITLTAPKEWGFLADDALYIGATHGPGVVDGSKSFDKTHLYVGANINTPIKDLTFGVGYDAIFNGDYNNVNYGYNTAIAGYVSYSATEKLRISGRADFAHGALLGTADGSQANLDRALALTGTVSYDLWANVLSRLEVRWDHAYGKADQFGGNTAADTANTKESVAVIANLVYKF